MDEIINLAKDIGQFIAAINELNTRLAALENPTE